MQADQTDRTDPTHRTPRECVLELDAHPYRIQQIRRIVAAQLRYWRLDPLIQPAASATSELLANVHRHARPDKKCGVRLTLADDRLTVAVTDSDPRLPQLRPVEPMATTGRGLTMVEALSDTWGTDLLPGDAGKVVWFVLRTPVAVPTMLPVRNSVPFERAMAEPLPEPALEPVTVPVTGTVPEPAAVAAAA
ncbi:ATP-binding protein [Streptomyces sp. NPDC021020]|uniref:ATP-binding protein n=1 Tax=Streptomyces sp. NPDC021020 TaxID=3365109 RepID=UPI0037B08D03